MLSEDAQRTPLRESKKLLKEGYSVKENSVRVTGNYLAVS